MSNAEKIYELAKALPEEQAAELLDFAEYLLQKRSCQQSDDESRAKADKLLDFRQAAGLGQEMWRSVNVEQYIQQERAEWD